MSTRFEPVAEAARHRAPRVGVDPDAELGWFRRLWPVIGLHRRPLLVGLGAGLVALIIQVAAPAAARAAIDAAGDGERAELNRWIIVLVGLGLGRFVTAMTYRYSLHRVAWGVETDLRSLLYRHLTRLPFSYFDRTQSGEVISRANSDIRSIQVLLAFGPIVSMSVLAFVLAFGFMLTIHVPLTLVALSTLPGVFVFGQKMRNRVFPLSWVGQARQAELATVVDESVNGTRVVKSFAGEQRQVNLLARAADHLRWANVEAIHERAHWNPLIEALPRIGMGLVLLYGGLLAIDGQVSVGTLFAFNAYVLMLQAPFRMFGFLLLQSQRAAAAAARVYAVLDEPVSIADRLDAVDLVDPTGRVEFRGVTFAYPSLDNPSPTPGETDHPSRTPRPEAPGDPGAFVERDLAADHPNRTPRPEAPPWRENGPRRDSAARPEPSPDGPAEQTEDGQPGNSQPTKGLRGPGTARPEGNRRVLSGLDLVVEAGETVAIVGRTGSGKSTVARLLARFYEVDSGEILIDGRPIDAYTLTSLRHHVGLVFDEPFLFSASVHDNIAYGRPNADRAEVIAAATAAQADDFICELDAGYDTVVGERGYTLSGGQRQRIAIARTLLERPAILVLDDATSAIDVTVEAAIHDAIESLLHERTTILIAHRLSTIALADRVVLVDDGRIAAAGTHAELLASEPRYVQILAEADGGESQAVSQEAGR